VSPTHVKAHPFPALIFSHHYKITILGHDIAKMQGTADIEVWQSIRQNENNHESVKAFVYTINKVGPSIESILELHVECWHSSLIANTFKFN